MKRFWWWRHYVGIKEIRLTLFWGVGTLELDVPEFVSLEQDLENKTVLLNVEDANIKQQKEMWGMYLLTSFP